MSLWGETVMSFLGDYLNGYVLFILGYAVLLILIGAWVGRRVKSAEGFFVAGRRLSAGLLFTTLIAANLGAFTLQLFCGPKG